MIEPHRRAVRLRPRCRRDRQRGLSTPGILAIIATVAFVGTFAVKVGPAYLENMTINKIVRDKAADAALMESPRSKVYSALNRAYDMNNLHGMKAEDTVILKRHDGRGYVMAVKYEKRAKLFRNIDVVTSFGEDVTL